MAHTTHTVSVFDTECYRDYWLCKFDTGEVFQLTPDSPLDIAGLRRTLSIYTCVSFNGINYDMPIVSLALQGHDNATLKAASDAIIQQNKRPWEITRDLLEWCDHIDRIEVAPGQASLKMYGAKMHSRKLQDLPIAPDASIAWYQRVLLPEYCDNDLRTTRELFDTFKSQRALRDDMSVASIEIEQRARGNRDHQLVVEVDGHEVARRSTGGDCTPVANDPARLCGIECPVYRGIGTLRGQIGGRAAPPPECVRPCGPKERYRDP